MAKLEEVSQRIALEVDPSGYALSRDFLFRYYGVEVLPHVFPSVTRSHITVNNRNGVTEPPDLSKTLPHLPDTIHGFPTDELLQTVASTIMPSRSSGDIDRVAKSVRYVRFCLR